MALIDRTFQMHHIDLILRNLRHPLMQLGLHFHKIEFLERFLVFLDLFLGLFSLVSGRGDRDLLPLVASFTLMPLPRFGINRLQALRARVVSSALLADEQISVLLVLRRHGDAAGAAARPDLLELDI